MIQSVTILMAQIADILKDMLETKKGQFTWFAEMYYFICINMLEI